MSPAGTKQQVVLYIGHPFDMALFKRLIPLINRANQYHIVAIVAMGSYFREMKNLEEMLSSIADESILIPYDKIPGYNLTIYRLVYVWKKIRKIDKKTSILISIDKSQFIANYLNSHFKKVILIQAYEQLNLKKYYKNDYLRMMLCNLISLISGSKFIHIKYNFASKGHIWNYKVVNPHYKIFYISNNPSLPDRLILPVVASQKKSRKIVIFGSRYNDWNFLESKNDDYKNVIFSFYAYLQKMFDHYTIYYKPHPREKGSEFNEINMIFNNTLINVGISLNSELFLIEHNDIKFCFSLGSTSSRSAYEMGFSSKVFYKMLPLSESVKREFDNIFNGIPQDFFIRKLDVSIAHVCQTSYESCYDSIKAYLYELSNL